MQIQNTIHTTDTLISQLRRADNVPDVDRDPRDGVVVLGENAVEIPTGGKLIAARINEYEAWARTRGGGYDNEYERYTEKGMEHYHTVTRKQDTGARVEVFLKMNPDTGEVESYREKIRVQGFRQALKEVLTDPNGIILTLMGAVGGGLFGQAFPWPAVQCASLLVGAGATAVTAAVLKMRP